MCSASTFNRGMHSNNDRKVTESDIRQAGWMVRHYWRNQFLQDQAILKLGLLVRQALAESDDFKGILVAVADALRPHQQREF